MRKRSLIFILTMTLVFMMHRSMAQECPCCTSSHHEFDFWLGEWVVTDTTGKIVGGNTIRKIEDGCIINESWIGKGGTTGSSYNYYNTADSTWNQLWIDNKGGNLVLKGKLMNNSMVLRSELQERNKQKYYNQITWTPNPDSTVTQLWQVFGDNDTLIRTLFAGIYTLK